MRRFFSFVLNMDARAWRTVAVSFLLFGGVGLLFLGATALLGFNGEATVERWLGFAAHSPYALVIAVAAFAALAFAGVPQIVLIAAAVVAFGPTLGSAYSWVGAMVSAGVGFGLGRAVGAPVLRRFGGRGVQSFSEMVGRNGFLASLIVRLVPSAPFLAVNMAAGVTPMRLWAFALGTGIGIVPKILLVAMAGQSVVQARQGRLWMNLGFLVLALAIWIGAGLMARRWIKRREAETQAGETL
jgi:uncharacterized membrane protein YdjX (TVP38/TMEM64 family)